MAQAVASATFPPPVPPPARPPESRAAEGR